jgi:hypothetical protein
LRASSRLRSIATSTRPDLELIDRGTEVKDRVQIWRGGTHVESANRGLRNQLRSRPNQIEESRGMEPTQEIEITRPGNEGA